MWKICLTGTTDVVEGCELMTLEEATVWISDKQEYFEEENEFGDTAKYIVLDVIED